MGKCEFCPEPVDADDPETYQQVTSWVNGPKLDGPKLRERSGLMAHKKCIDHLVHGQAADQPELFEDNDLEGVDIDIAHVVWADGKCRISTNGQGHFPCTEHEPLLTDEPGKITKLTGPNSVHSAMMGGNASADCTCSFSPHREDCPRFGR